MAGQNHRIVLIGQLAVRLDVSLTKQELSSLLSRFLLQHIVYLLQSLAVGFGLDDHCFGCSLSLQDRGSLLSLGDVDVCDLVSLGREDRRSFLPFRLCLQYHALLDIAGRLDVFDFVSQGKHTPVVGFLINGLDDVLVQRVPLFECLV